MKVEGSMCFDAHAHYDDEKFQQDQAAVLLSLKAAGIGYVVNCACDLDSCKDTLKLMKTYDFLYGAMGVHPHSVKDLDVEAVSDLYRYCRGSDKVVAVGEIGLDYHYDFSLEMCSKSGLLNRLNWQRNWSFHHRSLP
ncbi:MAG: TatD family hydrolase [Clostridia bacterium]